jgi:hypothetical protein
MKTTLRFVLLLILVNLHPTLLFGQVEVSGDIAVTATALDRHTPLNTNFRKDDPFNSVRLRFFVRTWVTEDVGLFSEILMDNEANARMNGAYLYVRNLVKDRVDLKAGMIPSPFGNYGLRSTYFNLNPLIGVPVLWHYKTGVPPDRFVTNEDLFDDSGNAVSSPTSRSGTMPVGYDACWDIGAEVLAFLPYHLDVSGTVTLGTLSSPSARKNDGYQFIGRVSVSPSMGVKFGLSYARGPFVVPSANPYPSLPFSSPNGGRGEWENGRLPPPSPALPLSPSPTQGMGQGEAALPLFHSMFVDDDATRRASMTALQKVAVEDHDLRIEDYHQEVIGGFVEWQRGHGEFFAEYASNRWEEPFIREYELGLTTGYAEVKYTFLPGWFVAGRLDLLRHSTVNTKSDGTGLNRAWGHDFNRLEGGVGWRINRQTLMKGVYQRWDFQGEADVDLAALQLSVAF